MGIRCVLIAAFCSLGMPLIARISSGQSVPSSIIAEGVPTIPNGLDDALNQYRHSASAHLEGWLAGARMIVYRASPGETQQVFLSEEPGGTPRQLTDFGTAVARATPHPRRERLVLALDEGGDEKYRLAFLDLVTEEYRPFTNAFYKNSELVWSHSGRRLALSSDARNGKDFDLYTIVPPIRATGRRLNEAVGACCACDWSPDDRRIAAVEWSPAFDATRIQLIDVRSGQVETLPSSSRPGRPVVTCAVRWSKDGRSLYWLSDEGSEFLRLARHDLTTGETTPLTAQIPWDVDEFDVSGDGQTIVLVANEDGRSGLHFVDTATGRELPVPRFAEGRFANVTFRPRSREFAFEWSCSRAPRGIYSYDLESGRRTEWVNPKRAGPKAGRGEEPELIRYPTFDARRIPAFVRRPGLKFLGPHPVVIDIHGGPQSQYRPAFSNIDDYYLDVLGIAVIYPNIRGSTGYGRSYERLDDGVLRDGALKDIGSLLDWIATQPDLDVSRVAVRGGSYGGYMALVALIEYGDRLKAGIDIAGISDLESFMEVRSPTALASSRVEYGDERDPVMVAFFRNISPLPNAGKIRRPLLVIHGVNDPRVKIDEADRIVAAVRRNGLPVWYIRVEGEGHNFTRREHDLYGEHAQILFLKQYLL